MHTRRAHPFNNPPLKQLSPRPSLGIAEPGPGMQGGTSPFGRRGIRTPLDASTRETCAWETVVLPPTCVSQPMKCARKTLFARHFEGKTPALPSQSHNERKGGGGGRLGESLESGLLILQLLSLVTNMIYHVRDGRFFKCRGIGL